MRSACILMFLCSTVMRIDGVRFNQQLESDLFTQRSLERGKR